MVVLCASVILGSCRVQEVGPMQDSTFVLDKGQVTHSNLELNIRAGELRLSGGADKLIDGHFEFNMASDKPEFHSSVNGSRATVTIQEPEKGGFGHGQRNQWDIRLNNDPLLDLAVHCGAGKAVMDLGSIQLRSVQVHMGAGEVDLDLSGKPRRDYEVEIHGGVGKATVHLPRATGVWAEAHGGLGSIKTEGLEKKGDHYENELYDSAKVNVHLRVNGGIGEIRLVD